MTLIDHLTELRQRLVKSILAITVGAVLSFTQYNRFLHYMLGFYRDAVDDPAVTFKYFSPVEGITTRLTVCSYGGFIVALPVVMWQLWRFIAPGLYGKEKRYAIPFVTSSVALFGFGAFIALWTLPQALGFLVSVSGNEVETLFTATSFVKFVLFLVIAFGFSFEFPVVLVFLELVGVLHWRQLLKVWRYAVVGVFVFAALATPSQDPYSLVGMALPMVVFYFVSILIGRLVRR